MLRSMIICADPGLLDDLTEALRPFDADVDVCRVLREYPEGRDLIRMLRAHGPGVVFLSFQDSLKAAGVAKVLFEEARGLQVIAVHHEGDPERLRDSMRSGIREFLTPPFETSTITHALGNVLQNLELSPVAYTVTDHVLAFLPSKAGAGATSLALNVSAALAGQNQGPVFLGDLDLNSGAVRHMLQIGNPLALADAVSQFDDLDEIKWPGFVTSIANLDVAHAGPVNPAIRLDSGKAAGLIQFLRRNYRAVCLDLSGNLERYSIAVMQEARYVVLVCAPEIPSLHLAREKMAFLANLDLDKRVLVVLNRVTRQASFSKAQVEDILDTPVFATACEDNAALVRAAAEGIPVDPRSMFGRDCAAFAEKLVQKPTRVRDRPSKFLQYFALGEGEAPETNPQLR